MEKLFPGDVVPHTAVRGAEIGGKPLGRDWAEYTREEKARIEARGPWQNRIMNQPHEPPTRRKVQLPGQNDPPARRPFEFVPGEVPPEDRRQDLP